MGLYNSLSSTYGFKVDPDHRQDRSSGPVIPRQMTEEEKKKYSSTATYKKPSMVAVNDMAREDVKMKKINEERLLEICKEHGFTFKAYNTAATEFGVETSSIAVYVSKNKLNKGSIEVKKNIPDQETKVEAKVVTAAKETTSIVDAELEIISQIKTIVEENKAMKHSMLKIKSALEDILKSIA